MSRRHEAHCFWIAPETIEQTNMSITFTHYITNKKSFPNMDDLFLNALSWASFIAVAYVTFHGKVDIYKNTLDRSESAHLYSN